MKTGGICKALSLTLGLVLCAFWITPPLHLWTLDCSHVEAHGCAPVECATTVSNESESASSSDNAHDPDACPICRLAALPFILTAPFIRTAPDPAPPQPGQRGLPVRLIPLRYEGFSFGARAPPAPMG